MSFSLVRILATGIMALYLPTVSAFAQGDEVKEVPPKEQVVQEMSAYLNGIAKEGFAGVVRVVLDGEPVLEKAYGFSDRAQSVPMKPNMVLDLGSITKVFTAAAILKLHQGGKLNISDAVGDYVPLPDEKAAITIEQLLRHTSGLPDVFGADEDYVSKEWILDKIREAPLLFKPGTDNAYSNVGYSLLGIIIEQVSGESYESFVRKNILEPAGATQTGYQLPTWQDKDIVCGLRDGQPWGSVHDYYGPDGPSWHVRANGAMLSTADELDRWWKAMVDGKILAPDIASMLLDGFTRTTSSGKPVLVTSGDNMIFSAFYLRYRECNLSVVVLTSSSKWPYSKVVPELGPFLERLSQSDEH